MLFNGEGPKVIGKEAQAAPHRILSVKQEVLVEEERAEPVSPAMHEKAGELQEKDHGEVDESGRLYAEEATDIEASKVKLPTTFSSSRMRQQMSRPLIAKKR